MELPPATAYVWWTRQSAAARRLEALLDESELRRLAAYRQSADRERFVVGVALAKYAVSLYVGVEPTLIRFDRTCPRCSTPHGKPILRGSGIEFSIAHSGDVVAVAVADAPAGIDVEQHTEGKHLVNLPPLVFAEREAETLQALAPTVRANATTVVWTRKEAVVKATGAGLALPLNNVVVSPPNEPARLLACPGLRAPAAVSLFDLALDPSYAASLAVVGWCNEVEIRDGSALLGGSPTDGIQRPEARRAALPCCAHRPTDCGPMWAPASAPFGAASTGRN